MAKGKSKEPKEPKAPKEKKPKKEKPPKKPKPPKKEKPPKKGKPPKGQEVPQEGEELEEGKKKKPIILLLIPIVVIAIAAAVVVYVFVLPGKEGESADDPGVIETPEPLPPELPPELMVGDVSVPGMTLEADESGAQAVLAKTVTYTYTNLNNAGAAAETYVTQLKSASPGFSIVDEDFVRIMEDPDFTAAEGEVLLARSLPKPAPEAVETPEPPEEDGESGESEDSTAVIGGMVLVAGNQAKPGGEEPLEPTGPSGDGSGEPGDSAPTPTPEPEEPVEEIPGYVISVRISWSEGQCVVTADEEEGQVTSPQTGAPGMTPSVGIRDAEAQLQSMTPAELGLPGTSMTQYEVFPQSGTELVNDVTCIRLDVYNSSDGPNPYLFASSYLMSVDGAHLYKLDPITDELQELDFTLNVG